MDDYEKNAFDLNNEVSEKDYSETQNESAVSSRDAETSTQANTQEGTQPKTPKYNANIPGPTKYDQAYRTYRDAPKSSSETASSGGDRQGFAITSLVLGIVSLLLLFIPLVGWVLGCVSAAVGIVFGILGRKSSKRTLSVTGLVLSVIAAALCIIFMAIFCFTLLSALLGYLGNYSGSSPNYYYSSPFRSVIPYLID